MFFMSFKGKKTCDMNFSLMLMIFFSLSKQSGDFFFSFLNQKIKNNKNKFLYQN
jgi:hypothetical protein